MPLLLRHACILLLAVFCLGIHGQPAAPDVSPPGEARLASAGHFPDPVVARKLVVSGEVLSRHERPPVEKSPGPAALSANPAVSLTIPLCEARGSALSAGHYARTGRAHRARGPPAV